MSIHQLTTHVHQRLCLHVNFLNPAIDTVNIHLGDWLLRKDFWWFLLQNKQDSKALICVQIASTKLYGLSVEGTLCFFERFRRDGARANCHLYVKSWRHRWCYLSHKEPNAPFFKKKEEEGFGENFLLLLVWLESPQSPEEDSVRKRKSSNKKKFEQDGGSSIFLTRDQYYQTVFVIIKLPSNYGKILMHCVRC